jgi:superfamily II DNA helicase RecQ
MYSSQKGVIYCRSVCECEALAAKVKSGFYYSRLPLEIRRERLQQWIDSKAESRWIVATSRLKTGVDIKNIITVVHIR